MKNPIRFPLVLSIITILTFFMSACTSNEPTNGNNSTNDFMYNQTILLELPDDVIPFCENTIPASGGYHMIMCEDSNDPLGYSAYIKEPNGTYTKINLLIPDTLVFDSAKLLAMPSGGGGSGEDTIYMELIVDGQKKYVFFTTTLFSTQYWWNYEYRGEAPYSAEEIQRLILENENLNSATDKVS